MTTSRQPEIAVIDTNAPIDDTLIAALAELWNAGFPPDLATSAAFVRYNLRPSAGVTRRLFVVKQGTSIAATAIATALHGKPLVNDQGEGWVDALVVAPDLQRRGLGAHLLNAAEHWLAGQGCRAVQIGAGVRPFAPGPPETCGAAGFFERHGYQSFGVAWDMASNLAGYTPPAELRERPCTVAPATPRQVGDLLEFLRREFPGRWLYEAEMFLADGGRLSDFMLLWTERGVDGCCLLTFPDSIRPLERFYPYTLPKPWGQLGSIGISASCRGQGFGSTLLDAGLRRLHDNGVNGCIIDWTTLIDFYGKFGFDRFRAYTMMGRLLSPVAH